MTVLPLPELNERRTTADHIADALREAILTGSFEDGEELNQVALAKHFGVSRVPIREALRQLQAENLVSGQAHRRTVVTSLSLETVVEILEVRALLEGHLLEKAMANGFSADDLAALKALCAEMEETEDHELWLRRNREFHQLLYEPSEAGITIALADQLSSRVGRYLHLWSDGTGVERDAEANAEHSAIVAALEAGDVARARLELDQHISHTRDRVVDLFEQRTHALAE